MRCKNCPSANHTTFQCFARARKPMRTSYMNRTGKVAKQWQSARELWFKRHPGDKFKCFYCKRPLARSEVTLDHYLSRGRHPELRNELNNLVVSCWGCNNRKGSLSGDEFIQKLKEETRGGK